jgi:hypothetical protein
MQAVLFGVGAAAVVWSVLAGVWHYRSEWKENMVGAALLLAIGLLILVAGSALTWWGFCAVRASPKKAAGVVAPPAHKEITSTKLLKDTPVVYGAPPSSHAAITPSAPEILLPKSQGGELPRPFVFTPELGLAQTPQGWVLRYYSLSFRNTGVNMVRARLEFLRVFVDGTLIIEGKSETLRYAGAGEGTFIRFTRNKGDYSLPKETRSIVAEAEVSYDTVPKLGKRTSYKRYVHPLNWNAEGTPSSETQISDDREE